MQFAGNVNSVSLPRYSIKVFTPLGLLNTKSPSIEPLGAVIGYLILRPFLNSTLYGIIFASIAGIMVYIAIEELIPMAREYDKGNSRILGCIGGMIIMAVSLIMFM